LFTDIIVVARCANFFNMPSFFVDMASARVMTSQPKRAPICVVLSIAATVSSWLTLYLFIKLHPDTSRLALLFVQMFPPFAGLAGLILAVIALIRRERFWFLALLTLLLGLAMVGLFCFLGGGIDEKG
jgi:hypothetical protein